MVSLKLLTWNVNYRFRGQIEQFEAIERHKPHLIALQEITPNSKPLWEKSLREADYYLLDSYSIASNPQIFKGARKSGLINAARWEPTTSDNKIFDIPWKERVLSCMVNSPWGQIEFHNAHMPSGTSHGMIKVETFEGLYKALATHSDSLRLLCGDFNSPKAEKTISFGGKQNLRWIDAELNVIRGLAAYDLSDIYRQCNGFNDVTIKSWVRQWRGKAHGARLDHIFASQALNAITCVYDTTVIENGLSDHAIMIADFEPNRE
jgi:exonuclease III